MAEERLIDDDKDRRYKIRKNADGEDELYIDDSVEEGAEEEVFYVPDDEDEEQLLMTPEQIELRKKMQEEAEKARLANLKEYLDRADAALLSGDFYAAVDEIDAADEFAGESGEYYTSKLLAYSRNLTDFSRAEECEEAADSVKKYASDECKERLKGYSAEMRAEMDSLRGEVKALKESNDQAKAERREIFLKRRKNAATFLLSSVIPLAVFIVLCAVFGTKIHAVNNDYTNLTLTIVFGALAGVAFIVVLVALNKLWSGARNVKRNESNFSTKLGREYEEKSGRLNTLVTVYTAFSEYDIS